MSYHMNDSSKSAKSLSGGNLYKVHLLLPVCFQPDITWNFQMHELPGHCFKQNCAWTENEH